MNMNYYDKLENANRRVRADIKRARARMREFHNRYAGADTVAQYDECGKEIGRFVGVTHAEEITGVARSSITKCLKGKLKTAGGYRWKRITNN